MLVSATRPLLPGVVSVVGRMRRLIRMVGSPVLQGRVVLVRAHLRHICRRDTRTTRNTRDGPQFNEEQRVT